MSSANERMMAIPAPFAAMLQRLLSIKGARWVLAGAGAALLVAVLGYLYFKTQGADVKRKNEALALLRELKEIDVRWDVDLWRTRMEFTAPPATVPDTGAALARVRRELAAAAPALGSPAVTSGLPDLINAFAQKAEMVDKFRKATAAAKLALSQVLRPTRRSRA